MEINKKDLSIMERMRKSGHPISEIYAKFAEYDYWEIHWSLEQTSFLGLKRMITNRLNKIENRKNANKINELKELINCLYYNAQESNKKLQKITEALTL